MSTEQVAELIMSRKRCDFAVSLDGSSFDSTQFAELRLAVEGPFWRGLKPWLISVFAHPDNVVANLSPQEAAERFIQQCLDFKRTLFIPCPDVPASFWKNQEQRNLFSRYLQGSRSDYLPFTLDGTMASGDPFTTLTNTFRSLLYYKYILRHKNNFFILAAGDDVMILPRDRKQGLAIKTAVLSATSRTTDVPSPLGQVVKECKLSDLTEADFCSKWIFRVGTELVMTRDYAKVLTTKQFYTRKNAHLLSSPVVHRAAILAGVQSETASTLLEDVISASCPAVSDLDFALISSLT